MQKTIAYEPTARRVQVVLKKKRSNECFADSIIDAQDNKSIVSQQSLAANHTFAIAEHCWPRAHSVSATILVSKPGKLFLYKERDTNATAFFTTKLSTNLRVPSNDERQSNAGFETTEPMVTDCKRSNVATSAVNDPDNRSNDTAVFAQSPAAVHPTKPTATTLDCQPVDADSPTTPAPLDATSRPRTPTAPSGEQQQSVIVNEPRLSNRLSRGFFDFAQNSGDRLQRWKSKLQNGRRHKDSSEPPPISRRMLIDTDLNDHATDAEVVLDWSTVNCSTNKAMRDMKLRAGGSISTPRITRPRVIQPNRSTSDLQQTFGPRMCEKSNGTVAAMEHRTLRRHDERLLSAHIQNVNFHRNDQIIGNNGNTMSNLPPPVRITPFSGVKPKDSDILRPTAFRPYIAHTSFDSKQSTSLAPQRNGSTDVTMRSPINDDRRMIKSKDCLHAVPLNGRLQAIYQPSTSADILPKIRKKCDDVDNLENDYDVVPECFARDLTCIDNHSIITQSQRNSTLISGQRGPTVSSVSLSHQNINCCRTNSIGSAQSPHNSVKKSSSSYQILSSNTSSGSRQSSGIHVTPSPSDSGIVDYEMIIRDKENELNNVRSAMEQNEEVVINVYLEKEKLWKEQIAECKQKLQASQQGESALRQEMQRCGEQKAQFQEIIQNLTGDKQGLQRKCLQLERELFQLRERNDELIRTRDSSSACDVCVRNGTEKRVRPPVPTPRHTKDPALSSERELRGEIDQLRGEVCTLRETLNGQISLFSDERRRWEEERTNILCANGTQQMQLIVENPVDLDHSNACLISSDRLI